MKQKEPVGTGELLYHKCRHDTETLDCPPETSTATYCLVDGHSQFNHAPELLSHSSAHWDIRHGDDLDGDSLVPLIPKVL